MAHTLKPTTDTVDCSQWFICVELRICAQFHTSQSGNLYCNIQSLLSDELKSWENTDSGWVTLKKKSGRNKCMQKSQNNKKNWSIIHPILVFSESFIWTQYDDIIMIDSIRSQRHPAPSTIELHYNPPPSWWIKSRLLHWTKMWKHHSGFPMPDFLVAFSCRPGFKAKDVPNVV